MIAANRPVTDRAVGPIDQASTSITTFIRQVAITNGTALNSHVISIQLSVFSYQYSVFSQLPVSSLLITDYWSLITVLKKAFARFLAQFSGQNHSFEQG